jgi:LPS export ABC transporter permease LptG/LPS export ABC transporter permease LptF
MLRTLDRYIFREVLVPFILALLVFTFLLQIAPLGAVAEKLIAKGVSGRTVAWAMINLIPQAMGITIPMAFLLGLLVAFGRLSDDREWVAMQACGVSVFRLLRPAFALGVLATAATAYVMIWAVPNGNQAYREIAYNEIAARAEGEVKPRVFFDYFPNMVLYARDLLPASSGWTDVFVADTGQRGQPVVYLARHGRLAFDRPRRTVELILENGIRHLATPDPQDRSTQKYEVGRFDRLVLSLNPDIVFPKSGPQKGDREMTIAELKAHIANLEAQGISIHNPVMEIHKKFSIPVACLVFAVMGLALGVSSSRSGKLASFVLGLMVIFGYYVVMYTAESLAKAAMIPAWLAPWTPNVVIGCVAVVLLASRRRSSERIWQLALPFRIRRPVAGHAAASPARSKRGGRVLVVVRVPHGWAVLPSILDLYISKRFVRILLLTAISLLGLFYISTFIDLSDKLFKGTTTFGALFEFFWFQTPQFVYYVIPLSLLIGGLVTMGALTKSSELIVMKACGISVYRAAAPLLVFAVLSSGVLFFLEEQVLADSNRRAQALLHVIRGGSPQTFDVLNRQWVVGKQGEIYNYAYFDPRRAVLTDLSIYEFHPTAWVLARRTFAGQTVFDRSGAAATAGAPAVWHASRGWVRDFTVSGDSRTWRPFSERDLALEPPEYFGTEQPEAERMTYTELRRHIRELEAGGFNVVPLSVQLQRKLSFPFVAVVMMLIAVPFAVTTGRRGALYGVGVGIALAITYWVMGNIFAAVGSGGLLAPMLAAWAPNLLFGAAAAYLLLTIRT